MNIIINKLTAAQNAVEAECSGAHNVCQLFTPAAALHNTYKLQCTLFLN